MRDVNCARWLALAAVGSCALLSACATGDLNGGGNQQSQPERTAPRTTIEATTSVVDSTTTTVAATTTAAATTTTAAVTTTTLAPDPWEEVALAGLDEPTAPHRIEDLRAGPGGLLLSGLQTQDDQRFVAVSRDGGSTWQKAIGDDSSEVVQRLVPLDDGSQWTLLVSSMLAADGTGSVARWAPGSDGKFEVETQFLTGLEFDDVVSQDDSPTNLTFYYDGPSHAIRLTDGSYLAAGTGSWGRYLDTMDSTPYLAQSIDGTSWSITPGPDSGARLTEEQSVELFDTPSGPLLAQAVTDNGARSFRLQRADGTFATVFEQPHEEYRIATTVEVVPTATGITLLYRALGTGDDRIAELLTSADGSSWQATPLEVPEFQDLSVIDLVPFGDQYALLGYATQSGATTRAPLLLVGAPGAWQLQDVPRFADVSPLAMVGTGEGGLLILGRDANGASVALTRGASGG